MEKIITQEVTNKELDLIADSIIGMLSHLNLADKYKVISALYNSLVETIKQEGGMIIENDKCN